MNKVKMNISHLFEKESALGKIAEQVLKYSSNSSDDDMRENVINAHIAISEIEDILMSEYNKEVEG